MTPSDFAANRENYCYRHPDRQSFVLCQRCTRTICSECQTQAPVGVICPECMNQQRKSMSPAQKRAGRWHRRGGVMTAVSSGQPVVMMTIAAVTAFVYLLQLIRFVAPAIDVQSWLAMAGPLVYPPYLQVWRPLTTMLVHGGFLHLGLNLLALWMLARILEPLLGHGRFLALYLISGFGGSVAVALLSFTTPVVGASGALFGMLGALVVIGRSVGGNITGILIVLGINLVIGFIPNFGVSWQAHVGGLVTGLAIGFVFSRTRRPSQRGLQIGLLAGITVILLLLMAVPYFIWY